MGDNNRQQLGYSTRNSLIKLRDDIRTLLNVNKQKKLSRYKSIFIKKSLLLCPQYI